jgi:hypothetical protein
VDEMLGVGGRREIEGKRVVDLGTFR